MASTTRESRRRKIVDRGSDRLALITGQIQAIPPQKLISEDSLPHISDEITGTVLPLSVSYHWSNLIAPLFS